MKLIVAGTPATAIPTLMALADSEHQIVAVLTRTDAPRGRKKTLTASPLATQAEELGLELIKADKITPEVQQKIAASGAELGVVVAYGALIPQSTLDVLPHGWINLHFSLLPHWRGAAPVQHGIWNQDPQCGISIFSLVKELDAGPLYFQRSADLDPEQNSDEVLQELAHSGATDVLATVNSIERGTAVAREQHGASSYAPKLSSKDGLVSWGSSAEQIRAQVNALTPEPGAYTYLAKARLKILKVALLSEGITELEGKAAGTLVFLGSKQRRAFVATSDGTIELLQVQGAGKAPMAVSDWARGIPQHELAFGDQQAD